MTDELKTSLQDLTIDSNPAESVDAILDLLKPGSSLAQLKSAAEQVASVLVKFSDDKTKLNAIWETLVNHGFQEEEQKDGVQAKEFLYLLIDTNAKIKPSFVDFINSHKDTELPKLYNSLLTHSDRRLHSLLLCFSSVKSDLQLKFVDFALENLKAGKNKCALTELQLVSRFYLHLTKETTPSIFVRAKTISVISSYADRRNGHDIISQVVMIIAKLCELDEDTTQRDLISIVEDYILEDTNKSLIIAFSLTGLLFHINSNLGFSVFTLDSILKQEYDSKHFLSEAVVTAALDLLSAACVHKECRAQIKANFLPIVKQGLESPKKSVVILAASILVKTNYIKEDNVGGTEKDDSMDIISLSLIFEDEIATGENKSIKEIYGAALEGLAYTSLLPEVKKRIIVNKSIVANLVDVVASHCDESPWVFCTLSTLANLTSYAPKISAEQQKLKQLKDYANKSNEEGSLQEPDSVVASRCNIILNTSILDALSKNCPRFTLVSRNTTSILLRNLASEKKDRAAFAQKGGLTVLLYLILPSDKPDQFGNKYKVDDKHLNIALSGLARTLISIDPSLALSSKLSPSVAILPLVSQLQNESSDVPLLDTFEALLALTNIASIDDGCRNLILRHGWTKIESLITANNTMVQRAAIELLCNVAASPLCAEKFLDDSPAANSRLEVLAALTDLEDDQARSAATAALAMLSEWGPAADVMIKCERLVGRIVDIVKEETSDDILIRGLVILQNLVVACTAEKAKNQKAAKFLQDLKDRELSAALANLATRTKDPDITGITSEIYKSLAT